MPVHQVRRKTEPPLQITIVAEKLSWFHLFPYGRNGLQESRSHPITPLDYCQARVMEFFRAKQNVGVVLRMHQGETDPKTWWKTFTLI